METYYLYIFILNIVLALCDASIGYHLAPILGRSGSGDDGEAEKNTRYMRKLLSCVVAVYVFLDCIAYSGRSLVFLLAVTGIITLDMVGQLFVRHKLIQKTRN